MSTPQTTQPSRPDWVDETPELSALIPGKKPGIPDASHGYSLAMIDNGEMDEIDLDREEYIALKRHLAAKRGLLDGNGSGHARITIAQARKLLAEASDDDAEQLASVIEGREWARSTPIKPAEDFLELVIRSYAWSNRGLRPVDIEGAYEDYKIALESLRWSQTEYLKRNTWLAPAVEKPDPTEEAASDPEAELVEGLRRIIAFYESRQKA